MQAKFIRTQWENTAKTIASVYLEPEQPYDFLAGQYADLTIPYDNPDDRGQSRVMTFSSSPHADLLRFTTRLSPAENSSYKDALRALKPGAPVRVTDAMGDMILPLDELQPLVFVAGGIGVASYVSIIEWLTEQKEARNVTLLYAVRDADDIIFQKQFETYAAMYPLTRVLYTPDVNAAHVWKGQVLEKRLTADEVIKYVDDDAQIYLSGTEKMVEEIRQSLQKKHRIPQYRIAFDFFDGYTD